MRICSTMMRHPEIQRSPRLPCLTFSCTEAQLASMSVFGCHFAGHHCGYMSSSIFSYTATLNAGEHAFLCIPCLPNIFNSRFWREGLELKHKYAPVMANTGFGLHQYNPHMNIMRVRGNEVALVTSHALCGNLGQCFIWRQTCLLFF